MNPLTLAVTVTLVAVKPGRPPVERLLVDAQISNSSEAARWALIPSRLPVTVGGIDKLEQLTIKGPAGTFTVGRFLGTGGCYAVRLAPGARVTLHNLEISWWRDPPGQLTLPVEVRFAAAVDLGGSPMASWFTGDPALSGTVDIDMDLAQHTSSHRAPEDREVPLSASGATSESAALSVGMGDILQGKIGEALELDGVAGNAKAGAIVQVGNTPVYLAGIAAWPKGWDGEAVRVKGTLREQKLIPDPINERGELMQGAPGKQLVLEGATWEKRP